MKRLIVIGAGGYGQTVADIADTLEIYDEIVFLDDNYVADSVLGKCEEYSKFISSENDIYPAFGNNKLRMSYIEKLEKAGATIPTLIHKSAYISKRANLEKGVVVMPKAIINTDTFIKKGCIINCGAIIDHGCVIEQGVHTCIGAIVKAENQIPALMKVEAGQVIENRTYILNGEK